VTAALILAAGAGRRMGGPKALLVVDGTPLLHRMVHVAAEAGCDPILAVVAPGMSVPAPARAVENAGAGEGMASSLRAGIAALPPEAAAALILALDQPAVDTALLRRLLALAARDPQRPAACAYAGTLGVPALLPRRLFPDLLALQGDRGAKAILQHENAALLPFPEGALDFDRPEDLRR
jgi:CTP:molybdopterin cytidylyltransferase MocA